jgi:hypothetical protein
MVDSLVDHGRVPNSNRGQLISWYSLLCKKKMSTESFKRMSNASFLRSSESGDEVTGTQSEQVSFSCCMKKFKRGEAAGTRRAKMKSKESKYKVQRACRQVVG